MTDALEPKRCSNCGAPFACGASATTECWCAALPPLATIDPQADCLCPACLDRAARAQAVATNTSQPAHKS